MSMSHMRHTRTIRLTQFSIKILNDLKYNHERKEGVVEIKLDDVVGEDPPTKEETELSLEEIKKAVEDNELEEVNALITPKGGELSTGNDFDFFFEEAEEQIDDQIEQVLANTSRKEKTVNRLSIIQDKSPLLEEEKKIAEQEEDHQWQYKVGYYVDNATGKVLSRRMSRPWLSDNDPQKEKKFDITLFIPSFKLMNQFIHWKDRKTEGKGMHFSTINPKDPRVIKGTWPPTGTWGQHDGQEGPPPVTEVITYIGTIIDPVTMLPLVSNILVTFQKGTFPQGKELYKAISSNLNRNLRLFDCAYFMYSELHEYDKGSCKETVLGPSVNLKALYKEGKLKRETLEAMLDCKSTFDIFADKDHGRQRQEELLMASADEMDENEGADEEIDETF